MNQLGDKLLSHPVMPAREVIRQQLESARVAWSRLSEDIEEYCRRCQQHADSVHLFTVSLAQLNAWLDRSENQLRDAEKFGFETPDGLGDQLKTLKVCQTFFAFFCT